MTNGILDVLSGSSSSGSSSTTNRAEKMFERNDGKQVCVIPSFVAMVAPSNNEQWSIIRMASGHAVVVKGTVAGVRKVLYGW